MVKDCAKAEGTLILGGDVTHMGSGTETCHTELYRMTDLTLGEEAAPISKREQPHGINQCGFEQTKGKSVELGVPGYYCRNPMLWGTQCLAVQIDRREELSQCQHETTSTSHL